MIQGNNFLKEKKEYIFARFKTKLGLTDFFLGTFIWSYLVIEYKDVIFDYIKQTISFITIPFLHSYISYLVFGIFLTILGWTISYTIYKMMKGVLK